MKKTFNQIAKMALLAALLICPLFAMADSCNDGRKGNPNPRFSPEEYRQKGIAFVTNEAKLTQAEAAKFFPIFIEMKAAQRKLNMEKGKLMHNAWNENLNDAECLKILNKVQDIDEDILDLEENYQKKFLKIISASKLLKVKVAEQRFERKMLREMANGPKHRGEDKPKQ